MRCRHRVARETLDCIATDAAEQRMDESGLQQRFEWMQRRIVIVSCCQRWLLLLLTRMLLARSEYARIGQYAVLEPLQMTRDQALVLRGRDASVQTADTASKHKPKSACSLDGAKAEGPLALRVGA